MYCIKCGKEIEDGSVFCINCGANQNEPSSPEVVQNVQPDINVNIQSSEQNNYAASAGDVFGYSDKSDIATAWLALLFGFVGFHDFYVGKPGKGILKLILCATLIGTVASFFMTMYDLHLLSKQKLLDGEGNVIRRTSAVPSVIFWVQAASCIIVLFLEGSIAVTVICGLLTTAGAVTNAANNVSAAATAVNGAATAVEETANAANAILSDQETTSFIQNVLHWINSLFN